MFFLHPTGYFHGNKLGRPRACQIRQALLDFRLTSDQGQLLRTLHTLGELARHLAEVREEPAAAAHLLGVEIAGAPRRA